MFRVPRWTVLEVFLHKLEPHLSVSLSPAFDFSRCCWQRPGVSLLPAFFFSQHVHVLYCMCATSLGPSVQVPVKRACMAEICGHVRRVSGHVNLVPCRLCTAYVPRELLTPGLLPEETHHSGEDLRGFHLAEKERRDERKQMILEEIKALREAARSTDVFGDKPTAAIRKKPAAHIVKRPAAAIRKKPAAHQAAPPRRNRSAAVRKKPSRA